MLREQYSKRRPDFDEIEVILPTSDRILQCEWIFTSLANTRSARSTFQGIRRRQGHQKALISTILVVDSHHDPIWQHDLGII
jgi:hypothetical protein